MLNQVAMQHAYGKASRRLFMLDYDGTLTPIVKEPSAAVPSDALIKTIKLLVSDPKNQVWIISGRDQAFLEKWMGSIKELGLSAEHGCFLRPRGKKWVNLTEDVDMTWQKAVLEVFEEYTKNTPGSFVEQKKCTLTWHYRQVSDAEHGLQQAREMQEYLEKVIMPKFDVEVMAGKANLEVRPSILNKGVIVKRLLDDYGEALPDFIMCAGDDRTDEDMFHTLYKEQHKLVSERIFAVSVGADKKTMAKWTIGDPEGVVRTIGMLVGSSHL